MKVKSPKRKEKRNIKGTLVKGKSGTYFRKPHQRTMDISVKQPDIIKDTVKNDMLSADIIKTESAFDGDRGVTNNVLLTTMQPKDGEPFQGYYKSIKDEPFISDSIRLKATKEKEKTGSISPDKKIFTRDSVKLLDRKTEKPLS
jgi:hypothetical protein